MPKTASLDQFRVNKQETPGKQIDIENPPDGTDREKPTRRYITKGFQVTRDAAQQFDILKAEMGPNSGPALIAEALNLLFKKYQKPAIA